MADIEYLKSLQAVRERANLVLAAAERNELTHFSYHPDKMSEVTDYVAGIINRDFGPSSFDKIPPHGRWQHFNVGAVPRVEQLIQRWEEGGCDKLEVTRRLVDLFFVAVLLDAGAGDFWKFTEPGTEALYGRSEGIAVAALYMFKASSFSSATDKSSEIVDGQGLAALSIETFRTYFQISPENEIIGDTSRVSLLNSVGQSLLRLPEVFGEVGRPGNLVDYLLDHRDGKKELQYEVLWDVLQKTLLPSWPKNRTQVEGVPIGDAWPLEVLAKINKENTSENNTKNIQPFHKLTQWLAYSLSVPFIRVLDLEWKNVELGTGLPEYRNGGLFVDIEVLSLREDVLKQGRESSQQETPSFPATSDVIVEWRAMTVALLDKLHESVQKHFSKQGVQITMAQMLEAGAWKGGRELAAKYRPSTKSSPIVIQGDGTLF